MQKGQFIKIFLAASLAISMMGADGGCDEEQTPDRTTRKNTHVEAGKKRKVTISVHGNGPYTVTRIASGPDEDGRPQTNKVVKEIAGGEYRAGYTYSTGTSLNVKVQVEGHGNDLFDCEIVDAGVKHGVKGYRSYDRGKGQAYCEIWTHG